MMDLSDINSRERLMFRIMQVLNGELNCPSLPKQKLEQMVQLLRTDVLLVLRGQLFYNNNARKKELQKFRKHLQAALNCRDALSVQWKNFDGVEKSSSYLQNLFPEIQLKNMILTCDHILGTKEPARYPKQRIILETLKIWHESTGKPPFRCAFHPGKPGTTALETEEVIPKIPSESYSFCLGIMRAIEGKELKSGFPRMYETVVRKYFP